MNKISKFRPHDETLLSDDWGHLTKYEYDYQREDGNWQRQTREVYDRGNGVTCLLYNEDTDCVLLTKQFRLPAFLNGGEPSLIETPAGKMEGDDTKEHMRQELMEETGYDVGNIEHLYDVYMSPGSVSEYITFFQGTYSEMDKKSEGGGNFHEGEDIEVLHIPLEKAMDMVQSGEIRDAKTIMLLQHLTIQKMRKALAGK